MALVQLVNMAVPAAAHNGLNLAASLLVVTLLTNLILGVGWIRHHWRLFLFSSRILGFLSAVLFLAAPSMLLVYGLCQSVANGFVDPALDLASFCRNRQSLPKKVFFFLGKVCHHGGGVLLAAQILRPLVLASDAGVDVTVFQLQVPLLIAFVCQLTHWAEDSLVLLRTAPKWLQCLGLPLAFIQTMSFLCTLLFDDLSAISAECLVATMTGNAIDFVADLVGNKISTHETDHPDLDEGEASCKLKRPPLKKQQSIARRLHTLQPISQDSSADFASLQVHGQQNDSEGGQCTAPRTLLTSIEERTSKDLVDQQAGKLSADMFITV